MRRRLVVLFLAFALPSLAWAAAPGVLTVYAAASLSEALQALTDRFTADTGIPVRLSFAASSALARQIEAGAPADLYLSADEEWMDYLAERQLIDPKSRRELLGNRLVLIGAAGDPLRLTIAPGFNIAGALGDSRLAVADPESVPAGRYAKAALRSFGAWDGVRNHLAKRHLASMKKNDRVLVYHSMGESSVVGTGIVMNEGIEDPTAKGEGWIAVELKAGPSLKNPVTLKTIKADPLLKSMQLVRMSRLSVMPVTEEEYFRVLSIGGE